MITPLVCLLSRPADAPTTAARIHYSDPALTAEEQTAILAWSDHPGAASLLDRQGQPVVVFRYFPLPSGRLALSRLHCPAVDGDGDAAEVVAHTLVFEPDQLPGYPLDYQDWPGWCEQPGQRPDSPPPLEPRGPRLEGLRTFLVASPEREQSAVLLLAGVLSRDRHGRGLLVRDLPERGLPWMACIQRLLPLAHALNLSLSSHETGPRRPPPRLAATAPGSDLDYRRVQQGEDYYIVDLAGRQRSTLPREDRLVDLARHCAARLVHWLLEHPGRLTAFHDFVAALFHHEALTPELWWLLRLFEASNSPEHSLAAAEVEPVLDVLGYYTRVEAWEAVLGLLEKLSPQLTQNQRFADDESLLGLYLEAVQRSGQPEPQQRAFAQWLLLFERYLLAGERGDGVLAHYREVAGLALGAELHQELLAAPRIARVQARIPELSAPDLGAVGWMLLDSALQLQHDLDDHQVWLDPLLARLLVLDDGGEQLRWLLTRAGEVEPAAALLHRGWIASALHDARQATARTALARLLHTRLREEPDAMALRRALLARHDEALLVAEWRHQLAAGGDRRALFLGYRREVLDQLPDYRDRCFGQICEALFEALDDTGRKRQARDWLLGDEEDWWRLPDGLAMACVALGNRQLGLHDTGAATRHLAAQVFARARELGQQLQPDIPQLRRSLAYAARGELLGDDDWFQETRRALDGIGEDDHRRFLEGVLDTLLRQALDPEHHARILQNLDNQQGVLAPCYFDALARLLTRHDPLATAVALRYWLDHADDTPLMGTARAHLLRGLERWPDQPLTALRQVLQRQRPPSTHGDPRWREFWRQLDGRRQQRLGMLGRRLRTGLATVIGRES